MKSNELAFQFISEPSDVNFGGKVHGGVVMKWIDQTAYACASNWAGNYCVTVYVGGIRFYRPIQIGDVVRVEAHIIYTGTTSMHIAVDVYSKSVLLSDFRKTTHCIIVFVALNDEGKPVNVPKWKPVSDRERVLEDYAKKLMNLRQDIENEMAPFINEN